MTTNPDGGTRDLVPLLDTPAKVADWLAAGHGYRANGAVLDRLCDTYGYQAGMAMWEAGGRELEARTQPADLRLVQVGDALAALLGKRPCPGTGEFVDAGSVDGDFVATCPSCRALRLAVPVDDTGRYAIEAHKAPRLPLHHGGCYDDDGKLECVCGAADALAERSAGIGDLKLALDGEPF